MNSSTANTNEQIQQGLHHHQQGQLSVAAQIYQNILAQNPLQAEANHYLGVLSLQQGQIDTAIDLLLKAIKIQPGSAEIYNNLGLAYYQKGDLQQACFTLIQASKLKPDWAELQANLGLVFNTAKRPKLAIKHYQQAITLKPKHPLYYIRLAEVYLKQGLIGPAIKLCQQATQLPTHHEQTFNCLGNCFRSLGKLSTAIHCYQQSLICDPNYLDAKSNLGLAQWENSQFEMAEQTFSAILAQDSKHLLAYHNLASLYEKTNRLELAETLTTKALTINPNFIPAKRMLATLLRLKGQPKAALAILNKIHLDLLNLETAGDIWQELGQTHRELKHPNQAFHCFSQCNRIQQQLFDPRGEKKNRFITLVNHCYQFYHTLEPAVMNTSENKTQLKTPIFLVGFPRSGTTLLDQILDSHPNIKVIEEQPLITDLLQQLPGGKNNYPQNLLSLSEQQIQQLSNYYLEQIINLAQSNDCYIVDKMPLNMIHVGFIHKLFPAAKIIFCYRHPLDVCLSNFFQKFIPNAAMANSFNLTDTAQLYEATCTLWERYCQLFPLQLHEVQYEALVEHPKQTITNLLTFLNIDWDNAVLNHAQHAQQKNNIYTPSQHDVRNKIYQHAKYRWLDYQTELAPIIPQLAPWIKRFGYTRIE